MGKKKVIPLTILEEPCKPMQEPQQLCYIVRLTIFTQSSIQASTNTIHNQPKKLTYFAKMRALHMPATLSNSQVTWESISQALQFIKQAARICPTISRKKPSPKTLTLRACSMGGEIIYKIAIIFWRKQRTHIRKHHFGIF